LIQYTRAFWYRACGVAAIAELPVVENRDNDTYLSKH